MIHLDTNFLIQALVPSSAAEAKLQKWKKDDEALAISSIAWSEFLCGPLTQNDETLAQMLFPAPERSSRLMRTRRQNYSTRLAVVHAVSLTVRLQQ